MLLNAAEAAPAAIIDGKVYEQLFAFVKRRVACASDAEDLVQQVMLKVLTSTHPPEERWAPWLFRVARNAVIDATRRSRRVTNVPLDENTEGPTSVHASQAGDTCSDGRDCSPKGVRLTGEPAGNTEAIAAYLVTLLETLDEADRDALRYVDLDDHSQRHFAEEHELGYATAKSRVQRARQRLRRSLEDHCSLELDGRGVPIACTPRKVGCCGS